MTDVAIVGAGPAGSSTALRLARAGYEVALLERSRFPRIKVCGDYICAGAIRALQELGIADVALAGAHAINSILLSGFGKHLRLRLPEGGALSLARETLDERMAAAACAAGARLIRGAFLHAREERGTLRVAFRDDHGVERALQARVLIGADGAWSTVAQRCGLVGGKRRPGRWAVGGEVHNVPDSTELEMHVGETGYYARNPLTATTANSMLVLPRPASPREADAIVLQVTNGARRFDAEHIERPVAIGPLRYRAARVGRGRILLTGDAAELLDPFTGQGVATALRTSRPASAAVAALLAGEPERRVIRRYRAEWNSIIAPRRFVAFLVETIVRNGFLRQRALRSARKDGRLVHELLAHVSGASPARDALAPSSLLRLLAS